MDTQDVLINTAVNVASNFLTDVIKAFLLANPGATRAELKKEIKRHLTIQNSDMTADEIIELSAKKGNIIISGSRFFAKESVKFESSLNTEFVIKDSSSKTEATSIDVGTSGLISGSEGATIHQSKKGIKISA